VRTECRTIDCIVFLSVSDVLRHQTLCRSAASAANNTNALRAFTVRPLTSHPLIHSAYDASQQSFQTVASHQTATANLGVGSGIASHYTRTLRLRNICTGAPTGGLGFKAYYKAFQYEPSLSWEYKPWLVTIALMVLRLSFVQQLPWGVTTHHAELTG